MTEYVFDVPDSNQPIAGESALYYPDERDEPMPVGEEIVRCRDCENMSEHHYRDMLGFGRETIVYKCDYFWNADELPEVEPDGFCKWGERRKES